MKLKIKPYLLRLIKKNILYIISVFFIIVLLIVISKISIDKIYKLDTSVEDLTVETAELQKKSELFQTTLPSSDKIEEDIKLLNNLIPNIEDYFTIIYSLETLSEKTGFTIIGYSVNITKSTLNKLRISVTGNGDSASFIKFLNEYNFSGGRLVTSDKIELNPDLSGSVRVDLTFYNKNVNIAEKSELPTDNKMFQDLEALKKKVSFDFADSDQGSFDPNYPKKNNPF